MPTDENDGEVSSPGKGEDWDKWLIEETERFESEKRQLEADVSRMKRENAHLKGELARLRAPRNARRPIVFSMICSFPLASLSSTDLTFWEDLWPEFTR